MIKEQRSFFKQGLSQDVDWRIKQLKKLETAFLSYEDKILKALEKDLGKAEFESYTSEVLIVKRTLRQHIKKTKTWSKTKRKRSNMLLFGKSSKVYTRPKGVVLIISPFNYPVQLSLLPLITAIAAGNTAVLKLSAKTINTAKVLKEMLDLIFSDEYIKVYIGEKEITSKLLEENFDLIFFTGSPQVGKIVMEKASKHLTPVILELGGKSPAIVLKDADLKLAAERIAWGKFMNAGQTCVAPDYVLIDEAIISDFKEIMIETLENFYGLDALDNNDYASIVSVEDLNRQVSFLDGEQIIYGGKTKGLKLEPTLVLNTSLESRLMNEEIFGPILPILSIKKDQDIFPIIERNPNPLALYVFTKNKNKAKRIMDKIPFGGGMINDTILHLANESIPFGGIKSSGMSMYHGKYGFDNFSHKQSVVRSSSIRIPFIYPPYGERLNWFKKIFR